MCELLLTIMIASSAAAWAKRVELRAATTTSAIPRVASAFCFASSARSAEGRGECL